MAAVMPGTLGRYKVLGVIGRGAMGVVYKAVDPAIDRVVAIKTINLSLNPEELAEYEARFQQEIKAAGRFSHPNIVTVYDVGRTDELAYMAMEFLNGRELKDLLAAGQRLEVATAMELLAQVADGLSFAHEHGIVHRDIKPSNIMVIELPNGVLAKITDFGIARMPGSAVKTMTGIVLGSPRYMSPEQVVGKPLDARSDIFSLGVVIYETLTGVAPFDGDNLTAIMHATANVQPEPPSARNPAVPRLLDLIVAKALAKTLDDRYATMRELALDLREVGRQLSTPGSTPVLPARPPALEAGTISGRYQQDPAGEDSAVPLKLATRSIRSAPRCASPRSRSRQVNSAATSRRRRRCAPTRARSRSARRPRPRPNRRTSRRGPCRAFRAAGTGRATASPGPSGRSWCSACSRSW